MKQTLRHKRWLRKHPAPPQTPEGFVYAKKPSGLKLVPAEELSAFVKRDMDRFDRLPPELRREYQSRIENMPVTAEDEIRARQNQVTANFGFGRAG